MKFVLSKKDKKVKKSITKTVNSILIVSLIVGFGLTIIYFSYNQTVTLDVTTRNNLHQQADLLYQSIKNAMLPGNAPIAVSLLSDIKDMNPAYSIMLFRANGVQAFSDNRTITTVNRNLGMKKFEFRKTNLLDKVVIRGDKIFAAAVGMRKTTSFENEVGKEHFFTIYKPLLNLPKCSVCHGSDHTVRGVIKISSNISPVLHKQRVNLGVSIALFVVMVLILTVILSRFFQRKIIVPVKHIGDVCAAVTNGDFGKRVDIPNRDEIGVLGKTVNEMVEGLYERFQLSKFVSSSTIESIKNREKGTKVEIAIFFSDIRGFTSFSEKLSPEEVVGALNVILGFQTEVIHKHGGDIDKYVGDEVVALFSGKDMVERACRAAVEVQREIEKNSKTRFNGLHVGIGINVGEVILGMIGSEERADFTVIGDHVNFTSRLCDVAKPGQIIISDSVRRQIDDAFIVSTPYRLKVKGKEDYQRVYILKGESSA